MVFDLLLLSNKCLQLLEQATLRIITILEPTSSSHIPIACNVAKILSQLNLYHVHVLCTVPSGVNLQYTKKDSDHFLVPSEVVPL